MHVHDAVGGGSTQQVYLAVIAVVGHDGIVEFPGTKTACLPIKLAAVLAAVQQRVGHRGPAVVVGVIDRRQRR